MTTNETTVGLQKGTNWWGAFVIGLAGTILVTGIAPAAVLGLGAASIPLFFFITAMGVVLCFCLAELAAMMPDRTGGLPAYADQTFRPLGETFGKHMGGLSGWAYWLGWFPVAPINMILASLYIVDLFEIPSGRAFQPFGTIGAPVTVAVLIISLLGLVGMFIPSYLGIRLGAGFATVLGIVSMVPLTLLVFLPFFKPSSMNWSNVAGFHLPPEVTGSFTLYVAWIFIMTWSVLAMEASACYIGECQDPSRDAKIAMTASGLYGLFIYTMIPLMFVVVLGNNIADLGFDPLTVFTGFGSEIFGGATWVKWVIGIPLIVALLLSVLNAIMGVGRSLYQISEDRLIPRWFQHLNRHGVPDRAMGFNVVCSAIVVLFGSPLRIYVFSNMGYLLACALALVGYFVYRHFRPELARPVRMRTWLKWVALALGVFFLFVWAYGGWYSPVYVVGEESRTLVWIGLIVIAAYLPLYWWRQYMDRREGGLVQPAPAAD